MAERGRRQRKRTRQVPPGSRRDSTAAVDARTDDALRTLVRVLARQACMTLQALGDVRCQRQARTTLRQGGYLIRNAASLFVVALFVFTTTSPMAAPLPQSSDFGFRFAV